jgi:hypothetical protein
MLSQKLKFPHKSPAPNQLDVFWQVAVFVAFFKRFKILMKLAAWMQLRHGI